MSAKSIAAFVAAAKELGVTPAEVADYLIGSVCRDPDDPTHGLLSDVAAGGHIPLDRNAAPAPPPQETRIDRHRRLAREAIGFGPD